MWQDTIGSAYGLQAWPPLDYSCLPRRISLPPISWGGICSKARDGLGGSAAGHEARRAIVYLDEIVEARKDTTVIIHPLSDATRACRLKRKARFLKRPTTLPPGNSYTPGYQSVLKDLKQSTKQRFMAIEFDYPAPDVETTVVEREAGVSRDLAASFVKLGGKVRNLKNHGLEEGVSTRLLIYAGTLIRQGVAPDRAC